MRIADAVFDAGLQVILNTANALHITSAEATTFAEATTNDDQAGGLKLGTKAAPAISAQENPGTGTGRQVRVAAFVDGVTDVTGTGTHWALLDTVGGVLIATGSLTTPQGFTAGKPWELTADLPIILRDPV